MAQIFTMSSNALPSTAHVVGFVGREAISEPYVFQVGLEINDEGFDPDSVLRAEASLELHPGPGPVPHAIHGIVAAVELLHTYAGKALYRLTLVPKLWHLGHSVHSRVYTDNTVIETIEAVLRNGGLGTGDFRFQLLHDYAKLEHVCQYKESDLAFISRWMEREGLYYFFDHSGDREQLVITDSITFHSSLTSGTARYVPLSGADNMALEALDVFMAKHSALPSRVKLTDYDYLRPKLDLQGAHDVDGSGIGVVQLFGENLRDSSDGKRYARVRAEEQLTGQKVFHGRGRVFRLRPNHRFSLDEHPIGAYNGKSYLVTELEHVGNQSAAEPHIRELLGLAPDSSDEYLVHVTAITADVQYRAPRRASWPRVDGYELAVVCGEAASEYAQIDEHGRYKCRVMFDESDLVDGSATTWVRMMQPHGGGVEGFHFPLRKGTEILLFFLAGDPDRPVIAGVTPNPLTPSPVTSGNHTQNVVQTGGHNRIELEDQAGAEYVTMSTPYSASSLHMGSPVDGFEVVLRTDDNTLDNVGKNFKLDVGHTGGGSWEALINDNWITHVETGIHELWVDAGTSATTVEGDTSLHVKSGNYTIDVDAGTMTTTVKGDKSAFVTSGNYLVDVATGTGEIHSVGKLTLRTDDQCEVNVGTNMVISVGGDEVKEVKGSETKKYIGPHWEKSFADNVKIVAGMKSDTFLGVSNSNFVGLSTSTFVGQSSSLFLGGKVSLESSRSFSATYAEKIELAATASLALKLGVSFTINGALDYGVKLTKAENSTTKLETSLVKLLNSSLNLSQAGIHFVV